MLFLLISALLIQSFVLLGKTGWFFELFTHYTLYYAVLGTVILLYAIALQRWKSALLFATLISINLATFAPYILTTEPSLPLTTATDPTLSILSQNFYYKNTHFEETATQLATYQPDIFIIHEAGPLWGEHLNEFQTTYPYLQITQETGVHGIVMGSKIPGTFQEIPLGTEVGLEFIPSSAEPSGPSYRLLAVHPQAPVTPAYATERNAQFSDITTYVNSSPLPTLVVGDFNSTPWSPYFQDLLSDTKLQDTRLGFGIIPTWHAHNFLFQLPIDFVLASSQFQTLDFRSTEKTSSDHRGIFTLLHLNQ